MARAAGVLAFLALVVDNATLTLSARHNKDLTAVFAKPNATTPEAVRSQQGETEASNSEELFKNVTHSVGRLSFMPLLLARPHYPRPKPKPSKQRPSLSMMSFPGPPPLPKPFPLQKLPVPWPLPWPFLLEQASVMSTPPPEQTSVKPTPPPAQDPPKANTLVANDLKAEKANVAVTESMKESLARLNLEFCYVGEITSLLCADAVHTTASHAAGAASRKQLAAAENALKAVKMLEEPLTEAKENLKATYAALKAARKHEQFLIALPYQISREGEAQKQKELADSQAEIARLEAGVAKSRRFIDAMKAKLLAQAALSEAEMQASRAMFLSEVAQEFPEPGPTIAELFPLNPKAQLVSAQSALNKVHWTLQTMTDAERELGDKTAELAQLQDAEATLLNLKKAQPEDGWFIDGDEARQTQLEELQARITQLEGSRAALKTVLEAQTLIMKETVQEAEVELARANVLIFGTSTPFSSTT